MKRTPVMTKLDWMQLAAEMATVSEDAVSWAVLASDDGETKVAEQLMRLAGVTDGLSQIAKRRAAER